MAVRYTYDNTGALATVTDSASGLKTTYYYDLTDRLMNYTETGTDYAHSVDYRYDSLNNLTTLVEGINGTGFTTSYTYDDDNRVSSITDRGITESYTYDSYGRITQKVTKNGSATLLTETYTYKTNSSGKPITATGTLANVNPLRYRGYVYDHETGLYYLQSRYYDPSIGRFINADSFAATGQGVLGNNMFAYCLNNPCIYIDISGHKPTYSLDTDDDGEEDCFVYVYHYNERVRRKSRRQRGYTINIIGKVYIFTGMSRSDFEGMAYPEGFNIYTDLMVLDETNGPNESMFAYQAQHVNLTYHSHIIACMKQYDADFNTPWDRSEQSLLVEWRSHNLFAPFDKSAQDVDFDNPEEGFNFWDYVNKAYNRAKEKFF